ncbi:MAG: hypothetical protein AAGL99_12080 [Pseudomonadota bacterium]
MAVESIPQPPWMPTFVGKTGTGLDKSDLIPLIPAKAGISGKLGPDPRHEIPAHAGMID